jgi:hypothetical protein
VVHDKKLKLSTFGQKILYTSQLNIGVLVTKYTLLRNFGLKEKKLYCTYIGRYRVCIIDYNFVVHNICNGKGVKCPDI